MIETKTVEAVPNGAVSLSKPSSLKIATPKGNIDGNRISRSFLLAQLVCMLISTIIVRSFWEFENASRALAFYGVYHRYGWNQVIHFFGVPGIIWSLLIFLVHVPLPFVNNNNNNNNNNDYSGCLNYAGFLAICYDLFYLSIDPLGAALYAPMIYAMYASAVSIVQKDQAEAAAANASTSANTKTGSDKTNNTDSVAWYGTGKALWFALLVHAFCWYLQIHLGHKIIEGAQPAVLQSLGGALSVAPLFAFYEGLWLLGINQGLQETTQKLVEEYTQELCTERGIDAMKACKSLLLQE